MKEDQEVKHLCKLCNKRFSSGRSLGGHMRSHLINDERHTKKKTSNLLVAESSSVLDTLLITTKVCKECGKTFPSWKALFGHMKCHSTRIPSVKQEEEEEEQDSWNSEANYRKKKRSFSSRKMKRYSLTTATTLTSSTLTVSNDQEQEQEEVAMSLIMLSKDFGNFVGLIPNVTTSCSDANSQFLQTRSSNKTNFECTTCNKIFKSYQALGGHKASHKRSKRSDENSPSVDTTVDCKNIIKNDGTANVVEFGESNYVIKKQKGYECPICFKIFTSGQALGGHKRSHLIAEAKSNIDVEAVEMQKPEIRELLDLNMPAPMEEESSTEHVVEFQSWWDIGSNSYKQEQFAGLLSN